MTAGTPRPRLTRADEKAIAKLLAEGDDYEVEKLALAINHYEATARGAKARLGKRNAFGPTEFFWHGGYRAAMQTILSLIRELIDAGDTDHDIILGVADVARLAGDLAFIESTAELWSGSES